MMGEMSLLIALWCSVPLVLPTGGSVRKPE